MTNTSMGLSTVHRRENTLPRKIMSLLTIFALAAVSLLLSTAPAHAVAPGAPTVNSITAGAARLTVAYTAPAPGDSAIITYQYSTDAGVTWKTREDGGTTASPLVITTLSSAVSPLVNGTPYSVAIRALNAGGALLPGITSGNTAATPSTTPTAPTVGVVTASSTQLSWAFTPLATLISMGGRTVTNYEYSTDGGSTWTARSPASITSPVVITGLTNGTTYSLALRAVNPNGAGTTSTLVPGTPLGVPTSPTITTITPSSTVLAVDFTAGGTGGSAITTYQYTTDGGVTWKTRQTGTTASPLTITSVSSAVTALTNGTAYSVGIRAVNARGNGDPSSFVSGTPATIPGAPTLPTAVAGAGSATVSWTAPVSNGGAAITAYTVTASPGGATCTAAVTTCTVLGLTPGVGYTFTVKATNTIGSSAASVASAAVIPTVGVPGAPTGVTGTAGNGLVSLTWTAPASTGGAAISSYTATASPGGATCTAATTSCVVTGLTNGTPYTFTVKATNSSGSSAASTASAILTPVAPAPAPEPAPGPAPGPGPGTSDTPATTPAPTPEPTPTIPTTLSPIPLPAPPPLGFATVADNAGETNIAVTPDKTQTGLDVTGTDWRILIGGADGGRNQTQLAAGTVIRITPSEFLQVRGSGYKPGTQANIYLMSTPILLGAVNIDETGKFSALLSLPVIIAPGAHTVQINGYRPNGTVLSVSLAVQATQPTSPIKRQQTFALGSPVLSAATKKSLDALIKEPKSAASTAALTVRDARTAAAIAADPKLAQKVATSVSSYLKAHGIKNPIPIRYVAYTGKPRPASKGILVTVFIR